MRRSLLLTLLLLAVSGVQAQGDVLGALRLHVTVPSGPFRENLPDLGFGLGGSLLYQFPGLPFALGLDGGVAIYGSNTFEECLTASCLVGVDVETTNNIAQAHAVLRLTPPSGRVRPYADGLIGFSYLFTESTIRDLRDDEDIASDVNFDDFVLSGGVGGGLLIFLTRHTDDDGDPSTLFLDVGARYLLGGEGEYLDEDGIILAENAPPSYRPERSRTDLVIPYVGVTFRF